MTNDEWEKLRIRSIMAAFQTGRPVLADSDGQLRYTDSQREQVAADVGVEKQAIPRAMTQTPSWWSRAKCWIGRHMRSWRI